MTGHPTDDQRRPDRAALVIAALLAGLALLILVQTLRMPVTALYARIGPTTVPYLVSAGLFALAADTAVSAWRGGFPARESDDVQPILWIAAALVAQMLMLKSAGFVLATACLFALTARAFGKRNLVLNFGIGLIFAFLVFVVFALGLKLSIPDPLFRALLT